MGTSVFSLLALSSTAPQRSDAPIDSRLTSSSCQVACGFAVNAEEKGEVLDVLLQSTRNAITRRFADDHPELGLSSSSVGEDKPCSWARGINERTGFAPARRQSAHRGDQPNFTRMRCTAPSSTMRSRKGRSAISTPSISAKQIPRLTPAGLWTVISYCTD